MLLEASPEFPIPFLKIYRSRSRAVRRAPPGGPGRPGYAGSWRACPRGCHRRRARPKGYPRLAGPRRRSERCPTGSQMRSFLCTALHGSFVAPRPWVQLTPGVLQRGNEERAVEYRRYIATVHGGRGDKAMPGGTHVPAARSARTTLAHPRVLWGLYRGHVGHETGLAVRRMTGSCAWEPATVPRVRCRHKACPHVQQTRGSRIPKSGAMGPLVRVPPWLYTYSYQ